MAARAMAKSAQEAGVGAVVAEAVGADDRRRPAGQARQRGGAGGNEHVRRLLGHHAADEQDQVFPPRRRRGQRCQVDAVGQHGRYPARRRRHAIQQPPAQKVGDGDDARKAAQQVGPLGRAARGAHRLRVVVQEQADFRLRQPAGEGQRDFRAVVDLDQRRVHRPQRARDGGGVADVDVAPVDPAWRHRAERRSREGFAELFAADHQGAERAGRGGQALGDHAHGAGAARPETLPRRQDDGNQGVRFGHRRTLSGPLGRRHVAPA
jgi:hypothetical protein